MKAWMLFEQQKLTREQRLKRIAEMGGFYVPRFYRTQTNPDTQVQVVSKPKDPSIPFPVQRHIIRNIEDFPFPHDGPVATTETIFDRVSIEIARGCTEGCRFCQAGMIYRPVRERPPEQVLKTIDDAITDCGYDEASLTSLSTADYSAIEPLIHTIVNKYEGQQLDIGVSSLRAYGLTEGVLDDLRKQRAGGLTFAPEAGSQRMRDVINKNISEEQLMRTAKRIFSRGWTKMKLYFMIGLPTERDEDITAIVQLGQRALEVAWREQKKKVARVTVNVSTHVPKPHTPFQWCGMDSYDDVLRKQQLLKDEAKRCRIKLRLHDSEGSWLEGVLAKGDRRLAAVISDAYDAGARFDSWDEKLKMDAWQQAMVTHAIEPRHFLDKLPINTRLAWDHIDVGLEEGFLASEYRKALKDKLSPPCGKVASEESHPTNLEDAERNKNGRGKRKLVCYDCGIACDMSDMHQQRLVALTNLNANKPRISIFDENKPVDTRDRQPMKQVDQGPMATLRLKFSKLGRMAFTSHLDLVRLFPRLFRRVGLSLYYSEGFRARPRLTFTSALSLGIYSVAEYVDVKIRRLNHQAGQNDPNGVFIEGSLQGLVNKLNEHTFEGIEFLDAELLEDYPVKLAKRIQQSTYYVGIPKNTIADIDTAQLEQLLQQKSDESLTTVRDKKGIKKSVDISASIADLSISDQSVLGRAGIHGDYHCISFTLKHLTGITAKPQEIVDAVFSQAKLPAVFIRESVLEPLTDVKTNDTKTVLPTSTHSASQINP